MFATSWLILMRNIPFIRIIVVVSNSTTKLIFLHLIERTIVTILNIFNRHGYIYLICNLRTNCIFILIWIIDKFLIHSTLIHFYYQIYLFFKTNKNIGIGYRYRNKWLFWLSLCCCFPITQKNVLINLEYLLLEGCFKIIWERGQKKREIFVI
jgi:hypothetical protein